MTGHPGDRALEEVLQAATQEAAAGLLGEALAEARAEVRGILRDRLVRSLLDAVASPQPAGPPPLAAEPGCGRPPDGPRRTVATEAGQAADGAMDRGVYLYGFTSRASRPVHELQGIEGSQVYTIVEQGVAAVVSDVDRQGPGWGVGEDTEADLAVLAPHLAEHEQVLEAVLASGTVLPARFGTFYRSGADIRTVLQTHAASIQETLRSLEGKVEWGLIVSWDAQRAAETGDVGGARGPASRDDAAQEGVSSGRAYLGMRQADKARAERLAERGRAITAELHEAIAAAATASVIHPVSPRRHGSNTLLRSSYLVDARRRAEFEAVIVDHLRAGADVGLAAELTGPWPPDNFAALEPEGAGR